MMQTDRGRTAFSRAACIRAGKRNNSYDSESDNGNGNDNVDDNDSISLNGSTSRLT